MLQVKKLASFDDLKGFDFSSVGFFQTPEYLKIFAKHFCKEDDVILLGVYNEEKLIGYGAFENVEGVIKFLGMKKVLGNNEVTDYGDIVFSKTVKQWNGETVKMNDLYNEAWEKILEWFKKNGFKKVELDYVSSVVIPAPLSNGVNSSGIQDKKTMDSRFRGNDKIVVEEQEVAPFINLPESWEEYVSSLEYKNRRELRRKINRLEKEKAGKHSFYCFKTSERSESEWKNDFQEFVRLVKLSENEKEKFMTKEMEEFFWDLCNMNNNYVGAGLAPAQGRPQGSPLQKWHPVINFLTIDSKNAAAILTFENGEEALGYNSGYDSEFIYFSPGFLSHAFKIKQLIEKQQSKPASAKGYGEAKYDFLRGNERYKYDLGAKEEKLWKITISV